MFGCLRQKPIELIIWEIMKDGDGAKLIFRDAGHGYTFAM
jgi:hypothetical protein